MMTVVQMYTGSVSASIVLYSVFIIILARQRVDQNTVDCENQELEIIYMLLKCFH